MVLGSLLFVDVGFGAGPCPGDCNGDGVLSASDIGRLHSLLVRCSPCDGRPGAVATGCPHFAGCPQSDLNGDGCFTAAELAFIMRSSIQVLPTDPGACRIDKADFPPNKRRTPCDCNADGYVGPSDLGRVLSLTRRCTVCADGSPGAPAAGCAASPGCPSADPDGDGCIRPGDVERLCVGPLF